MKFLQNGLLKFPISVPSFRGKHTALAEAQVVLHRVIALSVSVSPVEPQVDRIKVLSRGENFQLLQYSSRDLQCRSRLRMRLRFLKKRGKVWLMLLMLGLLQVILHKNPKSWNSQPSSSHKYLSIFLTKILLSTNQLSSCKIWLAGDQPTILGSND